MSVSIYLFKMVINSVVPLAKRCVANAETGDVNALGGVHGPKTLVLVGISLSITP